MNAVVGARGAADSWRRDDKGWSDEAMAAAVVVAEASRRWTLTFVAEEEDGGSDATHGCGEGQNSTELIGTSSGSDATHGCGATEVVLKKHVVDEATKIKWMKYLRANKHGMPPEVLRSQIQKLLSLGTDNTVNYVYDEVPVPPASGASTGTQQPIEIRDWGTLVPDESAVAEPDRKWVEGTCYNQWSKTDGGVWTLTEWILDGEEWVGTWRSDTWSSNTWAETDPKGVKTVTFSDDGWSSSPWRG